MAWTAPRTYAVGELLTASMMNTFQRDNFDATLPYGTTWQTYTPQLTATTTNPTLGSGSVQQGTYYRVGKLVAVHVFIKFGTSGVSAGSGTYEVSLPVSMDLTNITTLAVPAGASAVGSGHIRDDSASGGNNDLMAGARSSTTVRMHANGQNVGDATPIVWAASDSIALMLSYPAA